MDIFLSIVIGYIIGSIPTAYILVKYIKKQDIRELGSGNVGTLNSYEITNSKTIGLVVLILDLIKGILSVIIIQFTVSDQFLYSIISLNAAVFGHCYSIWLKFKGGRGLATAAGGSIVLSPFIFIIWLISWYTSYKVKKNIHLANFLATVFVIILVSIFPNILNNFTYPMAETNFIFSFSISLLMVIILSKHIEPMKNVIKRIKHED